MPGHEKDPRCPKCGAPLRVSGDLGASDAEVRCENCGPFERFDSYWKGKLIGSGGFGDVFAAYSSKHGRAVALKVLSAEPTFKEEVDAALSLAHPNIARLYDFGHTGKTSYLAYEPVAGTDLRRWLRDHGKMPPECAAALVAEVADALQYAHSRGVLHRDVKPGNLLLDETAETPRIAVSDFGLALADEDWYRAGVDAVGSLRYMTPEELDGEPAGPSVDVYALGCVLYELLTGRPAFDGSDVRDIRGRIQRGDKPRPRALNRGVPRDLEKVCWKAMAPKKADRYRSAAALARALRWYVRDGPRWVRALAAVAVIVVASAVGFDYLTERRVTEAYYHTFVRYWGAPVGVGPVGVKNVAHRNRTIKFRFRGFRVQHVELVDSEGHLAPDESFATYITPERQSFRVDHGLRECQWEFEYDRGRVSVEHAKGREGEPVYRLSYDVDVPALEARAHFTVERTGTPQARTASGAAHVRIKRTSQGYDSEVVYTNNNNTRVPDTRGVYGERIMPDERHHGLPARLVFLDANDLPMTCREGYAGRDFEYDDQNNLTRVRFLGENEQPIAHARQYFRIDFSYDVDGNVVEEAYFDREGRPAWHKNQYHKVRYLYETNRIVEIAYRDEFNLPRTNADGFALCRITYAGDRVVGLAYFDGNGVPAKHNKGYHRLAATYTASANGSVVMKVNAYDACGRPVGMKYGYFGPPGRRPASSDLFEWFNLADEEQPLADCGAVAFQTEFDREGWVVRAGLTRESATPGVATARAMSPPAPLAGSGLPPPSKPASVSAHDPDHSMNQGNGSSGSGPVEMYEYTVTPGAPKDGRSWITLAFKDENNRGHQRVMTYDDARRLVEETYTDIDGKPVGRGTVAKVRYTYEYGNTVKVENLDVDGKAVRSPCGYSTLVLKYDDRGNAVEERYYDEKGEPCEGRGGYHLRTSSYDRARRLIEDAHTDRAGHPVMIKVKMVGILSRARTKYDEQNRWTLFDFTDGKGRIAPNAFMLAKVNVLYDTRGNQTESRFSGADDKPQAFQNGVARMVDVYDDHWNVVKSVYYDVYDRPTAGKDKTFSQVTRKYGPRHNLISRTRRGYPRERGYSHSVDNYDANGRIVQTAYFGDDEKLRRCEEGFALVKVKHDICGNVVEEAYYDETGILPALHRKGYAGTLATYDGFDNQTEISYLDAQGNLTVTADRYARVTKQFDMKKRLIASAYFDADGNCVRTRNGYASGTISYDLASGEVSELAFFDEKGNLVVSTNDYAKVVHRYDAYGHETERILHDQAGVSLRPSFGYARFTATNDALGNPTRKDFYDAKDNRILLKGGYAAFSAAYDQMGNCLSKRFFGTDNRPVILPEGYAGWDAEYDARGNQTSQTYLNMEGKRTRGPQGYARWTALHGLGGETTEARFFDEHLNPFASGDGSFGWRAQYDDRGNQILYISLGQNGEPASNRNGYVKETKSYDERGNLTEVNYQGLDGSPARYLGSYSKVTSSYDAENRKVKEVQSGYKGLDGYTQFITFIDTRGNPFRQEFRKDNGDPARNKNGEFAADSKYDASGHEVETRFLDAKNNLVQVKQGYAMWTKDYDNQGRKIEQVYLGPDLKPVADSDGIAKLRWSYDARGRVQREQSIGLDGYAHRGENGYSEVLFAYHGDSERLRERIYRGGDGSRGYTQEARRYDSDGRYVVGVSYLDDGKKPARTKQGHYGVEYKNDLTGNHVQALYGDANGRIAKNLEGVAGWRAKHDDRGNIVEEFYLDEKGNVTPHKDGNHGWKARHDNRGRQIDITFLDKEEKPFQLPAGNSRVETTYDEEGRAIRKVYSGYSGRPYVKAVNTLDTLGRITEVRFLDAKGDLVNLPNINAIVTRSYGADGRRVETAYFDALHQPRRITDGYSRLAETRDEHGILVEKEYSGYIGKPYVRYLERFDSHGRAEGRYLDASGSLVDSEKHFAIIRTQFGDGGLPKDEAYFDEREQPVLRDRGYHRVVWSRAANGRITEATFRDTKGNRLTTVKVVTLVPLGSAAAAAGLKVADVLVRYMGTEVKGGIPLETRAAQALRDRPRTLEIERDGRKLTLSIEPGSLRGAEMTDAVPGPQVGPGPGSDVSKPAQSRTP